MDKYELCNKYKMGYDSGYWIVGEEYFPHVHLPRIECERVNRGGGVAL